jgi:hypothetical protein
MLSSQSGELSFMRMYGQRAQVLGSIIIDGGSGYCKFGWSKYAFCLFCYFSMFLTTKDKKLDLFALTHNIVFTSLIASYLATLSHQYTLGFYLFILLLYYDVEYISEQKESL